MIALAEEEVFQHELVICVECLPGWKEPVQEDSKTKNIHVLFDRISVDVFKDNEENILSESSDSYFQSVKSRYNVENEFDPGFVEKAITELELPLRDDALERLVDIIERKIEELN